MGKRGNKRGGGSGGGGGKPKPGSAPAAAATTTTSAPPAGGSIIDKAYAATLFNTNAKQMSSFNKPDPFNPENSLRGFVCRKEGQMGGSMVITHVNDAKLTPPTVIYGTPKLAYPYRDFDNCEYKQLPGEAVSYYLANKWNGANVLMFKYHDAAGNVFISGKSKGAAFLGNSPFGAFLDLTREALGLAASSKSLRLPAAASGAGAGAASTTTTTSAASALPPLLATLQDADVQSKTFELCGLRHPHLVRYDFEIALKPLFVTHQDGSIAPAVGEGQDEEGPLPFAQEAVVARCTALQRQLQADNEAFRAAQRLPHKYEYNHFIAEGRVLYLLDARGRLLNRVMYKVKPKDIEEVHWANFDTQLQGRVREAVEKVITREKPFNAASLQEELDMGPKEWSRFGDDVWSYAQKLIRNLPKIADDRRQLLVLMGPPYAGKTTIARRLKQDHGWQAIAVGGSGEQSSVDAALQRMTTALLAGDADARVVLDHSNLSAKTRAPFLQQARALGLLHIRLLWLDLPADELLRRAGPHSPAAPKAIEDARAAAQKPFSREGFSEMFIVRDAAAHLDAVVADLLQPVPAGGVRRPRSAAAVVDSTLLDDDDDEDGNGGGADGGATASTA